MELRNLKRSFLAKKGIKDYYRSRGYKMTYTEVNIMVAIYLATIKGQKTTKSHVYKILTKTNNFSDFATVCKGIDHLVEISFLIPVPGGRAKQYFVSVAGRNEIFAIEQKLREVRCDKIKI